MKNPKEYEILLVDDDPVCLCAFGSNLEAEGYDVTMVDGGESCLDIISRKNFDLVLTDLIMSPVDGIAVLKKVKELNSDNMVIILTGHEDLTSVIDALRLQADDYLFKSCERDELIFRVSQCFEKLEYRRKMKAMEKALRKSHEDLERRVKERTIELERLNNELTDTNKALTILAKNIEKNKEDVEKKIALTVSSRIIPVIQNLRQSKSISPECQAELDILYNLTSALEKGVETISAFSVLSSTELKVAAMIKNGLSNEDIAFQLRISMLTVKTHRRSIRKKLNITDSRVNLTSYLKSEIKWLETIGG
jgi:DNA-binding NarL/FixJ family response regulator